MYVCVCYFGGLGAGMEVVEGDGEKYSTINFRGGRNRFLF